LAEQPPIRLSVGLGRLWEKLSATAIPLGLILLLAALLRWSRLDLRFNQITFAYGAYYEPYLRALDQGLSSGLSTFVGLHPPFYSALYVLIYSLWGAPAGYHLFSGLLSVAAVAATYGLANTSFGRKTGLLAAVFLAVSIYHLHYSLEINNYPLLVLTVALSQWACMAALRSSGPEGLSRWILAAVACVYTHVLGGALVATQLLSLLLLAPWPRKHIVRASMVLLVLCGPLLVTALHLSARQSTYHNSQLTWSALWTQVAEPMLGRFGPRAAVWILLAGALLGVVRVW